MTKTGRLKLFLILGLVLAVVFMNLPVVYTNYYHDITGAPEAADGNMDISSVRLDNGKIYLDGQWEFYWNQFISTEPNMGSNPDLIIAVPDSWSNYELKGNALSAGGFASYKLTLTGFTYDNTVTLFVPDFGGAYRAFIDGQLAAESGTLSKDVGNTFTVPKSDIYPVMLSRSTTHEIVIEAATARFGGLYMTPVLGDFHQAANDNGFRNAARFIMFGIALFSFISLIAIYTLNFKRKLHSIWLPLMIFFILLRIILTSEFYSIWQPILFANLSYESTNELMYFSTFGLKYLLIFLVQEQCGIKFYRKEKIGFLVYYGVLYFIYWAAPQSMNNQYLSVLIPMLTYVLDFYLFIKIFRGRQKLKKFGMVIFWGAILVIAGLTIDSYYINGKIFMNMSLTMLFLFTVFSFFMSWVYSKRVGDLQDEFTESSARLEMANNQIAMQKEYYDALSVQMNEIRKIKHDIRHFIGGMNRLAEEEKFDELRAFLSEYSEKTEMDRLPVFCEHVVGNSIIGYYYLRAKKYGISFESRCNIGRQIAISDSDLCIVLGNALENAINACRQMDNPEIKFVSVQAGFKNGQRLLRVRNSYSGRLETRNGHYVSSKQGKSHGMGIQNIERVVTSYGGVFKTEYNDKEFTLMAAVPEK